MVTFIFLLLLGQELFKFPVDYASAAEVGKDTVISVTYAGEIPTKVCIATFDLADTNFSEQLEQHCLVPTNVVGDFDVWKDRSLESLGNILVTVTYKNGKTVYMTLLWRDS